MSKAEVADKGSADVNVDRSSNAERVGLIVLVFNYILIVSIRVIAPPANRPGELSEVFRIVVIEVVDHPLARDISVAGEINEGVRVEDADVFSARVGILGIVLADDAKVAQVIGAATRDWLEHSSNDWGAVIVALDIRVAHNVRRRQIG